MGYFLFIVALRALCGCTSARDEDVREVPAPVEPEDEGARLLSTTVQVCRGQDLEPLMGRALSDPTLKDLRASSHKATTYLSRDGALDDQDQRALESGAPVFIEDMAVQTFHDHQIPQAAPLGPQYLLIVVDGEIVGQPVVVDDCAARVSDLALGGPHTCAVLETGAVRCWGNNEFGQLGYGHTRDIGDDELPSAAGPVDLGEGAVKLGAGSSHTCAVLDTGTVRCWGNNNFGQLGYSHTHVLGTEETPAEVGDVPLF